MNQDVLNKFFQDFKDPYLFGKNEIDQFTSDNNSVKNASYVYFLHIDVLREMKTEFNLLNNNNEYQVRRKPIDFQIGIQKLFFPQDLEIEFHFMFYKPIDDWNQWIAISPLVYQQLLNKFKDMKALKRIFHGNQYEKDFHETHLFCISNQYLDIHEEIKIHLSQFISQEELNSIIRTYFQYHLSDDKNYFSDIYFYRGTLQDMQLSLKLRKMEMETIQKNNMREYFNQDNSIFVFYKKTTLIQQDFQIFDKNLNNKITQCRQCKMEIDFKNITKCICLQDFCCYFCREKEHQCEPKKCKICQKSLNKNQINSFIVEQNDVLCKKDCQIPQVNKQELEQNDKNKRDSKRVIQAQVSQEVKEVVDVVEEIKILKINKAIKNAQNQGYIVTNIHALMHSQIFIQVIDFITKNKDLFRTVELMQSLIEFTNYYHDQYESRDICQQFFNLLFDKLQIRKGSQYDSSEILNLLMILFQKNSQIQDQIPKIVYSINTKIPHYLARKEWFETIQNNISPLTPLINGQLKYTKKCTECENEKIRFENFTNLYLNMPYLEQQNFSIYFITKNYVQKFELKINAQSYNNFKDIKIFSLRNLIGDEFHRKRDTLMIYGTGFQTYHQLFNKEDYLNLYIPFSSQEQLCVQEMNEQEYRYSQYKYSKYIFFKLKDPQDFHSLTMNQILLINPKKGISGLMFGIFTRLHEPSNIEKHYQQETSLELMRAQFQKFMEKKPKFEILYQGVLINQINFQEILMKETQPLFEVILDQNIISINFNQFINIEKTENIVKNIKSKQFNNYEITLEELIEQNIQLLNKNSFCENCQKEVQAQINQQFYRLPSLLVIILNKNQLDQRTIKFPFNNLDLTELESGKKYHQYDPFKNEQILNQEISQNLDIIKKINIDYFPQSIIKGQERKDIIFVTSENKKVGLLLMMMKFIK